MIDPEQFLLMDASDVSLEMIAEAVDSAMTLLNSASVKMSAQGRPLASLNQAWNCAHDAKTNIKRLIRG